MALDLTALRRVGVPYTQTDIAKANDDIRAQADPDAGAGDLVKRYHKAQVRDFDGDPPRATEMEALIAYLQLLGTLVDADKSAPQEQAHAPDAAPGAEPCTSPKSAISPTAGA